MQDQFRDLLERMDDKGYYEVSLTDVLKFAGGKEKLISRFKKAKDMLKHLRVMHQKFIDRKFEEGYSEVGQLHAQTLSDWVSNNAEIDDLDYHW